MSSLILTVICLLLGLSLIFFGLELRDLRRQVNSNSIRLRKLEGPEKWYPGKGTPNDVGF